MCSFNAINGVPGCANKLPRDPHPQEALGLRRLRGERLHRGGRAARVPGRAAHRRPVRPRRGRGRPRGRPQGAQRRHRPGDGLDQLPRLRRRPGERAARCRCGASTTPSAVSCGSSSAPACSRTPTWTSAAAAGKQLLPAEPRGGPPRGRALGGAAQERRPGAAARPDQVDGHHRPAGRLAARHARPLVGPRRRRGRRVAVRGHDGPEPEHHVHPGLHAQPQRALRPRQRVRQRGRLPGGDPGRAERRAGGARPRRDARDERRGGVALDARPARKAGGADRGDQGDSASRSRSCSSTGAR